MKQFINALLFWKYFNLIQIKTSDHHFKATIWAFSMVTIGHHIDRSTFLASPRYFNLNILHFPPLRFIMKTRNALTTKRRFKVIRIPAIILLNIIQTPSGKIYQIGFLDVMPVSDHLFNCDFPPGGTEILQCENRTYLVIIPINDSGHYVFDHLHNIIEIRLFCWPHHLKHFFLPYWYLWWWWQIPDNFQGNGSIP